MSKTQKKIYIEGYPYYFWEYEEQTKTKHKVLSEYLNCWIKILGKYHKLNYFDCFGGCGAYVDDEQVIYYGSPIETAKLAEENKMTLNRNVNIIVIEKDKGVLDNLKMVFENVMPNINPVYIQDDFDKAINELLDGFNTVITLVPTFFFIDPFGYKINMDTIKRIMSVPKSEVLINLMYNNVNRSIGIEAEETNMDNLFGIKSWREIKDKKGNEREESIISLYVNETRKFSSFSYAYKLKFPTKNRTYYYLVHLTNHYKGCSIMKSAFAKHNDGRLEYSGQTGNDVTFYDLPEVKQEEIVEYFKEDRWSGKRVAFDELIETIIDKTPYLEKEIRAALKKLIQREEISQIHVTSKAGGKGLSKADIVVFQENTNE